jgi:hypothetical protein
MTEQEIATDHIRRYPIELDTPACPPVVYDLPPTPLQMVMAALRGGDRWTRALVVAGIVLAIVAGMVVL